MKGAIAERPFVVGERDAKSRNAEIGFKPGGAGRVRCDGGNVRHCIISTEWEKRAARISYTLQWRFTDAQENAETPQCPGEGLRYPDPDPRGAFLFA